MLVLLADDQPLFRQALKATIRQVTTAMMDSPCDFTECASLHSLDESLQACQAHPSVWLVCDLALQGQSLFQRLDKLKQQAPQVKIIVVSANTQAAEVGKAFQLGIDGFIAKQQDPPAIQQAFEEILHGRRAISLPPSDTRSVHTATVNHRPVEYTEAREAHIGATQFGRAGIAATCTHLGLTGRETEVLMLLTDGYSNKQIALELGITEHTVKVHLTKIFRALRVSSRAQALAYLMRAGNPINH